MARRKVMGCPDDPVTVVLGTFCLVLVVAIGGLLLAGLIAYLINPTGNNPFSHDKSQGKPEVVMDPKALRVAANAFDKKGDHAFQMGDEEGAGYYWELAMTYRDRANRMEDEVHGGHQRTD